MGKISRYSFMHMNNKLLKTDRLETSIILQKFYDWMTSNGVWATNKHIQVFIFINEAKILLCELFKKGKLPKSPNNKRIYWHIKYCRETKKKKKTP